MRQTDRWVCTAVILAAVWGSCAARAAPVISEEGELRGCACVGRVGNVDCDYTDAVTLADLDLLVDHLFVHLLAFPNPQEANCDADPQRRITMGDLTVLIDHLFISLADLPWCPQPPNHPPETTVDSVPTLPFIDGPRSNDIAFGVRLKWSGTDREDNPYGSEVSAYRWKLFGPFDDSTYQQLISQFRVRVFRTPDGTLYRYGQPEPSHFVYCDTDYVHGQQVITCDTVLVDTISLSNRYGVVDSLLDVESGAFLSNPEFARIVDSSSDGNSPWSEAKQDTFYNVFAEYPSDTTTERHFIFWVTARDLDAPEVEDPTPAWRGFTVFEPRHERPVLVLDWQRGAGINAPPRAAVKEYWCRAVDSWLDETPDTASVFDSARDYRVASIMGTSGQTPDMLRLCLHYRVIILSSDDVQSASYWSNSAIWHVREVYTAVLAGTHAWLAMRVPLGEHYSVSESDTTVASAQYMFTWGIERVRFSGWYYSARYDSTRIEDFIAAQPADIAAWPALAVDSALLHQRYRWSTTAPWDSTLAALPEVDYSIPTADAEVLYTYTSLYGAQHPLGPEYSFEGLPVAVRVNRGIFRTVHSLFTPIGLAEPGAQSLVNAVLSWLSNPTAQSSALPGGN